MRHYLFSFVQLKCCGRLNYTDWFSAPWEATQLVDNKTNVVPKSCCRGNQQTCVNFNLKDNNSTHDVYTEVCNVLPLSTLSAHINIALDKAGYCYSRNFLDRETQLDSFLCIQNAMGILDTQFQTFSYHGMSYQDLQEKFHLTPLKYEMNLSY